MTHPHRINEARRALADLQTQLHAALNALRAAQQINSAHALGVDLPPERPLVDAMNAAADTFKGMKLPERVGP